VSLTEALVTTGTGESACVTDMSVMIIEYAESFTSKTALKLKAIYILRFNVEFLVHIIYL
jgi:hypothetical protein